MTKILRNAALGNAALAAALSVAMPSPVGVLADPPASDGSGGGGSSGGGAPSAGQLQSEFNNLSPEARAALLKQLQSNSGDLSKMTPDQMQNSFSSLPPDVQAQLRAKWDGLSDEQKAALKKMNPAVLKEMAMQQVKQMMKPFQGAIDAGRAAIQKVKDFVHKLIG